MTDQIKVDAAQSSAPGVVAGGVVQGENIPLDHPTPNLNVKKAIVAVHGVGDQYTYATIQSVVNQFCSYYRQPAAIPLGSFHTGAVGFTIREPYPQDVFSPLAFAEVYWAKVPRTVVDDKHTIEESKKWAGTIVERLRLRWKHSKAKDVCKDADFDFVKLVLTEMIQTLAVLERFSYLADKAGLFTFDLKKLLEDYLGDVQIVAEFGTQRRAILDTFAAVMKDVHTAYPNAEIFIVAHSEGTVVSFLGLLEAGRTQTEPGWIDHVRGFMTIGSPIDKHLILWPELFATEPPVQRLRDRKDHAHRIQWRNYYDHGDPIGFALDDARDWLDEHEWNSVFSFTKDDDFGFVRYPFPGKAHVDYWTDPAVFGHFIQSVVIKPDADAETKSPGALGPPKDRKREKVLSYVLPYVGVAALLWIAAYVIYKAVIGVLNPGDEAANSTRVIFQSVSATALLLLGITVATRIPRLTISLVWRGIGVGIAVLLGGLYLWIMESGAPIPVLGYAVPDVWLYVIAGTILAVVVATVTRLRLSWGLKPLVFLGTAAVATIIGYHLYNADRVSDIGPIWPVFLANAVFLYLWWLAALIFDLVFVWHIQIRESKALDRMREMIGKPKTRATRAPAAPLPRP
jgi:hypothetical protein